MSMALLPDMAAGTMLFQGLANSRRWVPVQTSFGCTASLDTSRVAHCAHPIISGVRMVEDDISIVPFSDAYETHCARYGREADAPILDFKARCCTPEGITADLKARLDAYQKVVEAGVTENIFSQFMYKTMVENNLSMWVIKKQFALSAAMSGKCLSTEQWRAKTSKLEPHGAFAIRLHGAACFASNRM